MVIIISVTARYIHIYKYTHVDSVTLYIVTLNLSIFSFDCFTVFHAKTGYLTLYKFVNPHIQIMQKITCWILNSQGHFSLLNNKVVVAGTQRSHIAVAVVGGWAGRGPGEGGTGAHPHPYSPRQPRLWGQLESTVRWNCGKVGDWLNLVILCLVRGIMQFTV